MSPTIKLVRLESIFVPEKRNRLDFDPLGIGELRKSISETGLIHPIVLRDGNVLAAGERRLRALKELWFLGDDLRCGGMDIPKGLVPCVDWGTITELERELIEYEENSQREDLSWQESAAATAKLLSIRTKQAEAAGVAPPTPASLDAEIAARTGQGRRATTARKELIVSRHISDPAVAGAKTLDDAFKVLIRKEEARKNSDLAATVGKTFTAALHTAVNEDVLLWLTSCPKDSFDVVCTDPPYGIGADEFGDSGGAGGIKGAHSYGDSYGEWQVLMKFLPTELFRIAKPQAHAYIFCDIDRFHELREAMQEAGWWVFRTPFIFHKPNAARAPWPEHGPQRQYDLILYAVKGKRVVTHLFPDVLIHRPDAQLDHHAQKPVSLYIDLLSRSIRPGDTVLDPFMGTGTIFPAAHALKCRATGIEIEPTYYGIALKRLEALKAQLELPL